MRTLISVVVILIVIGGAWYMLDYSNQNQNGNSSEINLYGENGTDTRTGATDTGTATATSSANSSKQNFMHKITIETNKGKIVFETYDADAPKAAGNFVALAEKGFYNGVIFHRVIDGFMIQGGDPTGTGMGGPGYKFEDELNPSTQSYKTGYVRGTVAMANSGPNTNGSQFFIMHADTQLPHAYTIFGRVVSGMDVVDSIATTPRDANDRPLTDVVMKKVTVEKNAK